MVEIKISISGGVLDWEEIPEGIKVIVIEYDNGEEFEITSEGTRIIRKFDPKR